MPISVLRGAVMAALLLIAAGVPAAAGPEAGGRSPRAVPPADAACTAGSAPAQDMVPFAATPAATLAALRAGDGSLALADGRRLVPRGAILPSRLAEPDGLAAAAALAAGEVLRDAVLRPGRLAADRHGRGVGDAALIGPDDSPRPLALALVEAGAAYADPASAPACAAALLAAEAAARAAGRGLWAVPRAVAQAKDAAALSRRVGLFAVVEGRVRSAGAGRDRVFLNFAERWREDFTVMLATKDFATIFGDGRRPKDLAGARVRVRGVLRSEGGPALTVEAAGQIEARLRGDERESR